MRTVATANRQWNRAQLQRLLQPSSVAIIGASDKPGSLGASVIANLDRMQYRGAAYLINPNRAEVGGRKCLKSPDQLPLDVDAAVLAVPQSAVLSTVEALARRRVGAAVIFSSGFAEGGEEGLRAQQEIGRIARSAGMVIEGPNCLGMVNYVDGVALTFVETPAVRLGSRNGIGIVSQSGAMACVLGVMLASRDLGISYSVSTGNEVASGVEDYLEFLLADPATRAIGMIVEQFRAPSRFLELARSARGQGKSIVLLHPGRSSAARESAATHTGAMAGDYQVMKTLVTRAGVLLVDSLEELSDVLEISLRSPHRPKTGAVMMVESGAFKALTLDLCEQVGLELPAVTDDSAPALRAAMPEFVAVSNPLDLTAQGLVDPDLYRRTLSAALADDRFGSVLFGIIQTDAATSERKFPAIIGGLRDLPRQKLVVFAGLDEGAAVPPEYIRDLRSLGVPYFPSPDRAIRAVARLTALGRRNYDTVAAEPLTLDGALPSGVIPEYRAKQLLGKAGIPFPTGRFVTTLEEARAAATELAFPVALKAQSAQLSHKSDAGGVVLRLRTDDELREGWHRLHASVLQYAPALKLDGVLVERMSDPGVELIVGARNDAEWGPVILLGFGGVQAELLHDVRLLPPDLTIDGIVDEIQLLKSAALLRGYRGSPALDVRAVADLVARVGRVLRAEPAIREIDLNPVVVYPAGEGVVALDALMLADSGSPG